MLAHELCAGGRSAAAARPSRPRRDLGLCAGARLSRGPQGQAQAASPAGWRGRRPAPVKVFVDTAPLMEKPLARGGRPRLAGQAHQSGVARLRLLAFPRRHPDRRRAPRRCAREDHCGSCRACLDICPTAAFPAPYQLDARRCISYLTIEHKGHIAREFRAAIGNRIYGCDDCLAVCPWNKFAAAAQRGQAAGARRSRRAAARPSLRALDDAAFRHAFAGSPVKRTGRDRFMRNVLIAIGNSGDRLLPPTRSGLLGDRSPLVRRWRCGRCRSLLPRPIAGCRRQRA